jgi:predicted nuclease of predicted toxin-antitoxin system
LRAAIDNSVVLATARAHRAVLWTQDADLDGLAGVKFARKK